MDISIIIPSYNTQDTIAATASNLSEHVTQCEVEILVIDCSQHSQVKDITQPFAKITYSHSPKRFNPGEGRNMGANMAKGELLIFIDADVRLMPGALDAAWKAYKSGKDIFGGALELNTHESSSMAAYLEHYFFNHESQSTRPPSRRSNLSSALMCFKREVFLRAGGFRDIPRMQDTELTERLKKQGQALYFCPDIVGLQIQDSPYEKVMRKIYINGQNLYYIRYQADMTIFKKIIFFIGLPFASSSKILRIIGRHLWYQNWQNRFRTLLLTPILFLAGGYWMMGFYNALLTEKGIGKDRH